MNFLLLMIISETYYLDGQPPNAAAIHNLCDVVSELTRDVFTPLSSLVLSKACMLVGYICRYNRLSVDNNRNDTFNGI